MTTLTVSTVSPFEFAPLDDVRCRNCGRLIVKWSRQGRAVLEVKCPRCGSKYAVKLST
jgi:DNA-directed RNA polymerase subunit RPC12/RpoP